MASRILVVAFVALLLVGASQWLTLPVSGLGLIAIGLWIREDRRRRVGR
jgi:hypothetical protein